MDPKTRIKLRKLLAELYDDSRKIRKVLTDAGLYTGRLDLSGGAETIWHDVLIEAEHVEKVEQLIETICIERPEKRTTLDEILGKLSSIPPVPSSPAQAVHEPTVTPTSQPTVTTTPPDASPPAHIIPIDLPRTLRLTDIDKQLLNTLFAQAIKLDVLSEFTDGRTATRVLLVRPTAADGGNLLPAVVKLGPRTLIEPEWQATQRQVLDRLPNFATVRGEPIYFADETGKAWGALRYAQVGDGVFDIESLSRYASHASIQDLWQVLAHRLFRQLGTLWQNTQTWSPVSFQQCYDRILPVNLVVTLDGNAKGPPVLLDAADLAASTDEAPVLAPNTRVRLDGFVVTECSTDGRELTLDLAEQTGTAYRLRVQRLENAPPVNVGERYPSVVGRVQTTRQLLLQGYLQPHLGAQIDLTQATVSLPDGAPLPNPLLALPTLLMRRHDGWLATIHGDLNLRNILIDPDARTAHIIDCASARQDHVLQDLLRLERDILTDLAAQTFFQAGLPATAIVHFYRQLHCATRGAAHDPGHFALPTDLDPALEKLFIMLVTVRQAARDFLAIPGDWSEYTTGLIIHLLGALKFRDLENSPSGQQPKAIAFWAAATLVGLLEELEQGDERRCPDITWRFVDIRGIAGAKGVTLAPDTSTSRKISEPITAYESLPAKVVNLPTADDLAPVQRRLDVAAPEQATLGRAFALAVAVRQNDSPRLAISALPVIHSGQAQLDWPAAEPFVRVRVQVVAPECTIDGEDSYTFKLYRNLDSVIYYFSLIPQTTGQLTIIVRLYQEADFLGSARAQTTVSEQVVGEVPLQLQSSAPVTVKREAESSSGRAEHDERDSPPIKILFLAANPLDTVRLRIDEEVRAIQHALRQAEYRVFEIQLGPAVRIEDLQDLLLQQQPDILHFSGHGAETNAIILHNAQGNSVPVQGAALGRLLRVLQDNLRCVVLNACYTAELASGLAAVIDCVVGIEDAISDEASLQFATAFYRALGYGRSVQEAFELGQVQIELAGLGDAAALHLGGENADKLRFVGEQSPAATKPTTAPLPPAPTNNADFLRLLLAQHQRNLQLLQRQKAMFGAGEEPLRLLNQIAAEEEEIAKLQQQLGA